MNVEIKYNSPLRFLDYDVSQYLYENYFPSSKSKDKKNIVNKQFKKNVIEFLNEYNLNNIYESKIVISIRRNLYRRFTFIYYLTINSKINYLIRKRKSKYIQTLSTKRAHEYKKESLKNY